MNTAAEFSNNTVELETEKLRQLTSQTSAFMFLSFHETAVLLNELEIN